VIDCAISSDLEYTRANPTFHHWRTESRRYGLAFQNSTDALNFERAVRIAINSLLHQGNRNSQWCSDGSPGGAGRNGRHLLEAAKGRKTPKFKKKIHVKILIVSFICVCVQEKQSVTASVYLSSAITLGPWLRPVRTSSPVSKT